MRNHFKNFEISQKHIAITTQKRSRITLFYSYTNFPVSNPFRSMCFFQDFWIVTVVLFQRIGYHSREGSCRTNYNLCVSNVQFICYTMICCIRWLRNDTRNFLIFATLYVYNFKFCDFFRSFFCDFFRYLFGYFFQLWKK